MNPDVVAIGETIVDFIPLMAGHYFGVSQFERCFGGAPMNFAVAMARLGEDVGAIAAVGSDQFGEFLIETLRRNSVESSQVKVKKARTTLAFLILNQAGDRTGIFFYRKPWADTADTLLSFDDIDPQYIAKAKVLHTSGVALSYSPEREAVLKAINIAKEHEVIVSFDLNIRLDLWPSNDDLRTIYEDVMKVSDIISLSEEEMIFFSGSSDPEKAAKTILQKYRSNLVAIKLGEKGCFVVSKDGEALEKPAFRVNVVDTAGAGDGWAAAFVKGYLEGWELDECVTFANAVGALITTKRGAITAMPTLKEVEEFLRTRHATFHV